jgi:hypothetical protein
MPGLQALQSLTGPRYPISKPDGTDCPAGMKRIVRIFVEAMFDVDSWEPLRSQAKTPTTPFVWANGNTECA